VNPDRFVTDSSLDFIARRLRFLGYDVATLRGARLEELFEAAGREGRIVLSRSARHPRRYGAIALVALNGGDPVAAVRAIAERYVPTGAAFSRCPMCNVALQGRHPMEARGEIPGRVLRAIRAVSYCPMCGKWYWEGTHVARIRAWLEAALGHPLVPEAETAPEAEPPRASEPPAGPGPPSPP
jgi:uncharacterized protein